MALPFVILIFASFTPEECEVSAHGGNQACGMQRERTAAEHTGLLRCLWSDSRSWGPR